MLNALKRPKSYYKNLTFLAIPIILQNILSSLVTFCDTAFVGTIGETEVAAVSYASSVFFIVMLFVFAIMSGLAAMVSQYYGKRDIDSVNRVIGVALYSCVPAVTAVSAVLSIFAPFVAGLFTTDARAVEITTQYMRIVAPSYILFGISSILLTSFRAMEQPKVGMNISGFAVVLNIILNWSMTFGHFGFTAMGVRGVAYATLISRTIELMTTLIYIVVQKKIQFMPSKMFRPYAVLFPDFFKLAVPAMAADGLWGAGLAVVQMVLGHISIAISASCAIVGNVGNIFASGFFGLGSVCGIIVGKKIGENDMKGAYDASKNIKIVSVLVGMVTSAIFFAISDYIYSFFDLKDTTVFIIHAVTIIYCIRMIFTAYTHTILIGTFRSGGRSTMSMMIDLGGTWLVTVPLAFLLAKFAGQVYSGIIVVTPLVIDDVVKSVVCWLITKKDNYLKNITRDFDENLAKER